METGRVEVLRVQDAEGRGPYRPGFSHRWSDPNGFDCPPWWEELGLGMAEAHARCVSGYHWGCAFTSRKQLEAWFNAKERRALDRLGYRVAFILPSIIAAETPRQIVIGTRAPLSSFRYARIESAAGRLAA